MIPNNTETYIEPIGILEKITLSEKLNAIATHQNALQTIILEETYINGYIIGVELLVFT